MAYYSAFLYVDSGTGRTHIAGWDPDAKEWRIPCNSLPRPDGDGVTYSPTKPLCRTCDRLTREPDPAPRTHHR